MRQAQLNIVSVGDVVPVAGGSGNLFFVLDGYWYFDLYVLVCGSLFGDFMIDFGGNVDLNGNFRRDGDFTFLEDLYLHRNINLNLLLNLSRHFYSDVKVDQSRLIILLLNFNDEWDLFSDRFEDGFWLFDFDGDLDHFGDFNSHCFDVFLGDLDCLGS